MRRTLLLSRIDATLELAGQSIELGTNFWASGKVSPLGYKLLHSFQREPVPTWTWRQEGWEVSRRLVMPHSWDVAEQAMEAIASPPPSLPKNRILVHYRYTGPEAAILKLRPLIADRNFHHQQTADAEVKFSQIINGDRILLQAYHGDRVGTPWQIRWTHGHYFPDQVWYWGYRYPEETQRGLSDSEDLFSPGYLAVVLQPGDAVTLEACVGCAANGAQSLSEQTIEDAIEAEQKRLAYQFDAVNIDAPVQDTNGTANGASKWSLIWQRLLVASDQFIVYRASVNRPTVIAGYHWFNDWGRDTLIALPGLALATQRFSLARGLLETFRLYYKDGLIPNTFPDDDGKPLYNGLDVGLWWIETLGLYLNATQDWPFLTECYPLVHSIYKALTVGTIHNIRVDAFDGLVTWDAPGMALTWMDTIVDGLPVTPRPGKAVEINALWYSALCWASQWASSDWLHQQWPDQHAALDKQARRYAQHASQVQSSLQKFWNAESQYFYDVIEPDDRPDATIRPNAVIALSLYHCGFAEQQAKQVLRVAHDRLLTPFGLRSLDPADPCYQGHYTGSIWQRDRIYHQGTVWSWLIGPFIRAWQRFYPSDPVPFDWTPLLQHFEHQAGLHAISEIFDGDPPHHPQGAIAQAWSLAEVIRHIRG
jgi:4-alpha-glucanotransferase